MSRDMHNGQYRSHFGSRYKSGPCFTAGLLAPLLSNDECEPMAKNAAVATAGWAVPVYVAH